MNDKYFNLDGEDLMTANEVAKLFNVSYSAVIGWAKLKKLKSIKINNLYRISSLMIISIHIFTPPSFL